MEGADKTYQHTASPAHAPASVQEMSWHTQCWRTLHAEEAACPIAIHAQRFFGLPDLFCVPLAADARACAGSTGPDGPGLLVAADEPVS